MENFKIAYIIFVIFVAAVICNKEEEIFCCRQGYVLKKDNKFQCWHPETNLSTPITLPPLHRQFMLVANNKINFTLGNVNQLVIKAKNSKTEFDPGRFCLGYRRQSNQTQRVAVIYNEIVVRLIDEKVYGYCLVVSSVCLLLTAFYYIVQKELRDLQGKSIINLCVSLGIGFGILAVMKLLPYQDMNLCAARGFFTYFFLITSFFWTNSLSIQIFLNMRRPVNDVSEESGFIWYALYSWCCPAVLTIVMAIVNYVPGDHLKPGIGLNHCWFFDNKQQWIYMYSVISVLLAVNIVIFIYLTTMIWQHSYSNDKIKQKFLQTIRLFVIMGVLWIFEMASSVAPHHWFWEVVDVMNTLQGVFILVILVLLPSSTKATPSSDGLQYKMNISVEQPYDKV